MNNVTINSPNTVYINNITYTVESQDINNTLDFHSELQKLHKLNKGMLFDYFEQRNKHSKAERVKACGNILTFKHYKDINVTKLDNASLCRERLCLNCNRMSARDNAMVLMKATEGLQLKHIVFSIKNCKGYALRDTIEHMKKALKYYLRSKGVKDYYQSYEITYNEKSKEFHPHIHILTTKDSISITARELNRQWAEAVNRFMGTSFKWLSCKCKDVEDNTAGAFELSKYVTKPQHFNNKTIPVFDEQLKGLHLHQANGLFKKRCKNVKEIQTEQEKEQQAFLDNFDYELVRYIFNGDNYIKCE